MTSTGGKRDAVGCWGWARQAGLCQKQLNVTSASSSTDVTRDQH